MTFRYLEHGSEVGVLAEGATAEEALADAARGLLGIQVDGAALPAERFITVRGTGADPGACLVDLLNGLIAAQDIEEIVFTEIAEAGFAETDQGFSMTTVAGGVSPAAAVPHRLTEVKAVTYQGLVFAPGRSGFTIRFVADV
ncbi:MAG: archease [Planctomycetes bacterium]|jgi:SHS2 domain-containing protein|nr:archease [Planctomycetota bacterium]